MAADFSLYHAHEIEIFENPCADGAKGFTFRTAFAVPRRRHKEIKLILDHFISEWARFLHIIPVIVCDAVHNDDGVRHRARTERPIHVHADHTINADVSRDYNPSRRRPANCG